MTATTERRTDSLVIGIAFFAFIGLGLTSGLLGVAWPSIRADFGLPLDAIGTLLLASTIGYISGSFFSVRLMARFGSAQALVTATTLMAASYLLMVAAPSWVTIILLSLVGGLGGGILDAGLNSYSATIIIAVSIFIPSSPCLLRLLERLHTHRPATRLWTLPP